MDGEGPALLQDTQGLPKELLLIDTADVVIDIVAGDRVEALIHKLKPAGITLLETDVRYPLCLCVFFAACLAEGGIFRTPAVPSFYNLLSTQIPPL